MNSVRAPWIFGLTTFLLLAIVTGVFLCRPANQSPVPRAVLDARTESTAAAAQAIAHSLNGGLGGLAEIGTVVDETLKQHGKTSLKAFEHRAWRSLYVVDRTTRMVLTEVGEPAQPAVFGEPMPSEPGVRRALSGSSHDILQYVPIGTQYLLVGHLDPLRLNEQLAVASPEGAWLIDNAGSVVASTNTTAEPPKQVVEGAAGSRAQDSTGKLMVVSWADLGGKAPASSLDWTLVSTRAVDGSVTQQEDTTWTAMVLAGVLCALVLVVFGWLYWVLLRPLANNASRIGEAGYLSTVLEQLPAGGEVRGKSFPHARIAWAVGGIALLGFATAPAIVASSLPTQEIPTVVATEQQTRTSFAARQVQRSLDSGVSDLSAVAAGLRSLHDPGTADSLLTRLLATRTRYAGVVLLSETGEVRSKAGDTVDFSAAPPSDKPSVFAAPARGVKPRVLVLVPAAGGRLIAELKAEALIRPLAAAGPGNTRLVDRDRRVVGATTGFTAFESLSRPDLDQSVKLAQSSGPGSVSGVVNEERHVLSWAPVASKEPNLQLGLSVVTDRAESALALPYSAERRELLLLAALVAALTVIVFGWLLAVAVSPLSELVRSAKQLVRGETQDAVLVRRDDSVGRIARDLERVRRGIREN